MKKTLLFILLLSIFSNVNSQIVTFTFTGALGDEATSAADGQPANATVSVMSRGSGTTPSASSGRFSASNWPTSGLNANSYYEFTITPNPNATLSLSSLVLSERRSGTGIINWEVRSSLDSYASTLGTAFTVPDNTNTRTGQTITFPANPSFTLATSAITFRIYGYNSEAGTGTWWIDDVVLNGTATLPISLTSFTGKLVDKSILLNWETASETNNAYFELLKSSNGKTFTAIGNVKGAGTTKDTKSYAFVDNNPAAGTNYYQLVQYDFDGKSSKSAIIPVNSAISSSSLTVYAAVNSVDVSINSANITEGTLQIFDVTGKKYSNAKVSLSKGFNNLSLPINLNSGIYVVSLITDSEVINSKFIKD